MVYTTSMTLNYFEHHHKHRGLGQKFADNVTNTVGSWKFIIIQSTILFCWIAINTIFKDSIAWDKPPFILLNLMLSFQAAYTAPFIMMSQNRQSQIDRKRAEEDYKVNRLAEQEIEMIQKQLDILEGKVGATNKTHDLLQTIHKELAELKVTLTK
jgi:uncharacterized membrane protein